MVKDTRVQELVINELTKEHYEELKNSGELNRNELYMVTDEEYVHPEELATVATTGDYNDLVNTPTIPTVDQTYNASSSNAQSGVAVAEAISNKSSVTYVEWENSSSTSVHKDELKINYLTQAEYDILVQLDAIHDDELYMITDNSSIEWGSINGNIQNQTDLIELISAKQDALSAGAGINISNNTISTNGNTVKIVDDIPVIQEDGVVYFIKED